MNVRHQNRLSELHVEIEKTRQSKADVEEAHEKLRMLLATIRGKVTIDAPVIAKAHKPLFEKLGTALREDDASKACVLCEKIMKRDDVQKLTCHDTFCKKCWDEWRRLEPCCPVCGKKENVIADALGMRGLPVIYHPDDYGPEFFGMEDMQERRGELLRNINAALEGFADLGHVDA